MSFKPYSDSVIEAQSHGLLGRKLHGRKAQERALQSALDDTLRMNELVNSMPRDVLPALDFLCECGDLINQADLDDVLASLYPSASVVQQVMGTLHVHGFMLFVGQRDTTGLLPPVCHALQPVLDARWRRAHLDASPTQDGERPAWVFATFALLAHLEQVHPRLKARGEIYARDMRKLEDLFESASSKHLNNALATLVDEKLVEEHDNQLVVNAARIRQGCLQLSQPWGWLPAASSILYGMPPVLLFCLRRPGWHSPKEIERVVMAAGLVEGAGHRAKAYSQTYARHMLEHALERNWIESNAKGQVRLHHAWMPLAYPERASATEQDMLCVTPVCHLQPNFEVIVPPEASGWTVYQLGRFARLKRFDTVATFVIERASVHKALSVGMSVEDILAALSQASRYPVPSNVAQSVRDFAAELVVAHELGPEIVGIADSEKAALVANCPAFSATPVPGVFWRRSARSVGNKALTALGLSVYPCSPPARTNVEDFGEKYSSMSCLAKDRVGERLKPVFTTIEKLASVPLCPKPPLVALTSTLVGAQGEAGASALSLGARMFLYALPDCSKEWWTVMRGRRLKLAQRLRQVNTFKERCKVAAALAPQLMQDLLNAAAAPTGPALLGRRAVELALQHQHDIYVWPAGQELPLRVTPHFVAGEGDEVMVACHQVTDGMRHAYPCRADNTAWAPRSSGTDLRRAATHAHGAAGASAESTSPPARG